MGTVDDFVYIKKHKDPLSSIGVMDVDLIMVDGEYRYIDFEGRNT